MVSKILTESDVIVLHSIESYVKSMGVDIESVKKYSPEEMLMINSSARDILYSEISQRTARLIAYVMGEDIETNSTAKGINTALSNHFMDPVFVNILLQYMDKVKNSEENGIVGSYIAKLISKYIDDKNAQSMNKETPTKKKKDTEDTQTSTVKPTFDEINHLQNAACKLLSANRNLVLTRVPNLTDAQALAVAACISMNNQDTVRELIKSDLPITADVLNMLENPSEVIKSVLLITNDEFVDNKLSANAKQFIDSLKRWVYFKINNIPTQTSYQFLVSVYGNIKIDSNKYWLKLKDCGNQYPNTLEVAKALFN